MANPDLTIADIILRYEELSPLTTKGSKLTKSEYDTSLMGIYNDMYRLMTMYDSASWNIADGCAITLGNKVLAAGQIRLFKQDDFMRLQIYDGASWVTCLEVQCTEVGGLINRTNYAAYTGEALTISVGSAAYVHITNAGNNYLNEEAASGFLSLATDKLTAGNIPTGYDAMVKMTLTIDADMAVPMTLKVLTREYNLLTADHTITITDIFQVSNTDQIYAQIKKVAGDPENINIGFFMIDFEIINTIPVSP